MRFKTTNDLVHVGENSEAKKNPQQEALETSAQDLGHRLGNFHNYYAFHPPCYRMEKIKGILQYISSTPAQRSPSTFEYCDLGCNEGDLTIEIARALQRTVSKPVHFFGMDIDSVLIERACKKWKNESETQGEFCVGNILIDLDTSIGNQSVDLISLLSTTMWIHVHAGDDGLKEVLQNLCRKSRQYILMEAQPSKCYRKATVRLRKLGRPELKVSSDQLKLRQDVETEIDSILQTNGFERVRLSSLTDRTEWNRSLELYERKG